MSDLARSTLLAAVVLCASPLAAQDYFPLADDPVLTTLLAETLERSPELRQADQTRQAEQARIAPAGALPEPMLGLGYENGGGGLSLGASDNTGLRLSASQAFPYPGKRRLAERVVDREAARSEQAAESIRRMLTYQLRRAFADLLLARQKLLLIADQKRSTGEIEELTRSRYAVGLAEQSDVLRAQAELHRLDQMRLHEEGEQVAAVAEINRLRDRPALTPVPAGPALSDVRARVVPEAEAVIARALQASPEIASGRIAIERAQAALELARRNLKPDLVASASYTERGAMPSMWSVDLGLVLPLHARRKQRPMIVEAEARLRAEEAGLEALKLRVRSRAEKNLSDFRAAVQESDAYEHGVLIVDGLAVESALASFRAGRTPFVSVLEGLTTWHRDRLSHAELLFHVLWHSASLDQYASE